MSLAAIAQKQEEPTVVPNVKEGKGKTGKPYWDFPKEPLLLKKVEMWFPKIDKPHLNELYPSAEPKYSATFVLGSDTESENVQLLYNTINKIAERDFVRQTKKAGKVVASVPLGFSDLKEEKLKLKSISDDPEKPGAFAGQWYFNASMGAWGNVEVFRRSNEPGKKIELMTPDEIAVIGNGSIVTVNISLQGYYIKDDNFGVKALLHGVLVQSAKAKGFQADNAGVFGGIELDDDVEDDEVPF